jgi:hypothetical protein
MSWTIDDIKCAKASLGFTNEYKSAIAITWTKTSKKRLEIENIMLSNKEEKNINIMLWWE